MIERLSARPIRSAGAIKELSVAIAQRSREMALRQRGGREHFFDMLRPDIKAIITDIAKEKENSLNFFFDPNFPDLSESKEKFSFLWLCMWNTFSEVLKEERAAGLRWISAKSIVHTGELSILALTGYGSLFHRNFDPDMRDVFYYHRLSERMIIGIPGSFTGELQGDLILGKSIVVETDRTVTTSTVMRLAGMPINGPEDIVNANGTFELMMESLKATNLN